MSDEVIGRSVEDRPITLARRGDPAAPRKVLAVGCIHGNEPAGRGIVADLVRASPAADKQLLLVRDMNPDGFAHHRRGNAHAVDLNRNSPEHWAGAGARPWSEPETRAIRDLVLREHGHDDLRLIDNGEAHHHSVALADLPSVRLYHLLPAGISKPAGVTAHMRARALTPEECVAVGDSGEDLTVAGVVAAMWLVANAFEHDPTLRAALAHYPNARVAEATHGAGVYEAVVTTLAQGR